MFESENKTSCACVISQFSKMYHGVKRADNPPHIFATADAAYRSMVISCKDQVVYRREPFASIEWIQFLFFYTQNTCLKLVSFVLVPHNQRGERCRKDRECTFDCPASYLLGKGTASHCVQSKTFSAVHGLVKRA